MEKVVQQIQKTYESKRESLIKSLSEKLDSKKVSTIEQQILKLKPIYEKKSKKLAELVHYSNIVSSFFDVVDESGKSKNTFRAQKESKGLSDDFESSKDTIKGIIDEQKIQVIRLTQKAH